MGKIIECHKVNPSSDCAHVVRGRDEDEVSRQPGQEPEQDAPHQHLAMAHAERHAHELQDALYDVA